ncbi:hypothetical protein RFI_16578, partial [Reticulomyxa filosa]
IHKINTFFFHYFAYYQQKQLIMSKKYGCQPTALSYLHQSIFYMKKNKKFFCVLLWKKNNDFKKNIQQKLSYRTNRECRILADWIWESLPKDNILQKVHWEDRFKVAKHFRYLHVPENTVVALEGEAPKCFKLLVAGACSTWKSQTKFNSKQDSEQQTRTKQRRSSVVLNKVKIDDTSVDSGRVHQLLQFQHKKITEKARLSITTLPNICERTSVCLPANENELQLQKKLETTPLKENFTCELGLCSTQTSDLGRAKSVHSDKSDATSTLLDVCGQDTESTIIFFVCVKCAFPCADNNKTKEQMYIDDTTTSEENFNLVEKTENNTTKSNIKSDTNENDEEEDTDEESSMQLMEEKEYMDKAAIMQAICRGSLLLNELKKQTKSRKDCDASQSQSRRGSFSKTKKEYKSIVPEQFTKFDSPPSRRSLIDKDFQMQKQKIAPKSSTRNSTRQFVLVFYYLLLYISFNFTLFLLFFYLVIIDVQYIGQGIVSFWSEKLW